MNEQVKSGQTLPLSHWPTPGGLAVRLTPLTEAKAGLRDFARSHKPAENWLMLDDAISMFFTWSFFGILWSAGRLAPQDDHNDNARHGPVTSQRADL